LQVVVALECYKSGLGDAKTGTFNLMLPPTNYRGAANGQLLMKRKQVLALFIDDKIDTGAIILSSEIAQMKMLDMCARQINASWQRGRY
jgi:hypothetical protein